MCEEIFWAFLIILFLLQIHRTVPLVNFFYPAKHPMTFPRITNETGLATETSAETSNMAGFGPEGLSLGPDSYLPVWNILLLFHYIKLKVCSPYCSPQVTGKIKNKEKIFWKVNGVIKRQSSLCSSFHVNFAFRVICRMFEVLSRPVPFQC